MAQTPAPYDLHDLKGRPNYIALGRYKNLLRDVVFLTGGRGWLEKCWLNIQCFYPRHLLQDRQSLHHWRVLTVALASPVTAALLWKTHWYKNTHFIGGVTTDDRRFFVKAYKQAEDADLAKQQSDFINHYFSSGFTIVPVMSVHDRVVLYPLLPHSTKPVQARDIEHILIDLHNHHLATFKTALKPALDYINLNLPNLFQMNESRELWQTVRDYLTRCDAIPMVPVHGDATPWNIFFSEKKQPVLVDYERAGWHVPYYDCWHFYCQPLIMRSQKPDLLFCIKRLQPKTQCDSRFLQRTALLYLLDQLAYDLQDAQDYNQQKTRLAKTIIIKLNLIRDLMSELRHD